MIPDTDRQTKWCNKCKEGKGLCEFWKDKSKRDGLDCWCKPCTRESNNKYNKENAERLKEYGRGWREKNSEHLKEYWDKRAYDLEPGARFKMLAKQGGVCAGCGLPETATRNGRVIALSVDHIEGTKKVRGLLCRDCNIGIGVLKHDPDRLENLAKYIRRAEWK